MPDSSGMPSGASMRSDASNRDILTTIQNAVQSINTLATVTGFSVTAITAFSTLGTTATQVLGADQTRTNILFHNPSSGIYLMVSPSVNITGMGNAPTFAAPGGGFIILPYDFFQISGIVCRNIWNAVVSSGTGFITIGTIG